MTPRRKRFLFRLLRFVVCVVALAWVLHGVTLHDYAVLESGERVRVESVGEDSVTLLRDGSVEEVRLSELARDAEGDPRIEYGLKSAAAQSNVPLLLLSLLVFSPVTFTQSLRFWLLLKAQDIHITYWESAKLCFAGNFLNFVAVGTTGGDVLKAYYICLHTPLKTEAVTTVFLDRVAGLAGLLALVGVVTTTVTSEPQLRAVGYFSLALLGGLVAGCALLLSEKLRSWLLRRRSVARLAAAADAEPGAKRGIRGLVVWVLQQGRRVDRATQRLLRHKRLVLGALGATVALQFIAISAFVLVARALKMDFQTNPIWDYYGVIASACIVGAIPISPMGLGTMEATYKHFLIGSHGTLSQILFMAMGIRLLQLIWALPGVLVAMTGAYNPAAAGAGVGPEPGEGPAG